MNEQTYIKRIVKGKIKELKPADHSKSKVRKGFSWSRNPDNTAQKILKQKETVLDEMSTDISTAIFSTDDDIKYSISEIFQCEIFEDKNLRKLALSEINNIADIVAQVQNIINKFNKINFNLPGTAEIKKEYLQAIEACKQTVEITWNSCQAREYIDEFSYEQYEQTADDLGFNAQMDADIELARAFEFIGTTLSYERNADGTVNWKVENYNNGMGLETGNNGHYSLPEPSVNNFIKLYFNRPAQARETTITPDGLFEFYRENAKGSTKGMDKEDKASFNQAFKNAEYAYSTANPEWKSFNFADTKSMIQDAGRLALSSSYMMMLAGFAGKDWQASEDGSVQDAFPEELLDIIDTNGKIRPKVFERLQAISDRVVARYNASQKSLSGIEKQFESKYIGTKYEKVFKNLAKFQTTAILASIADCAKINMSPKDISERINKAFDNLHKFISIKEDPKTIELVLDKEGESYKKFIEDLGLSEDSKKLLEESLNKEIQERSSKKSKSKTRNAGDLSSEIDEDEEELEEDEDELDQENEPQNSAKQDEKIIKKFKDFNPKFDMVGLSKKLKPYCAKSSLKFLDGILKMIDNTVVVKTIKTDTPSFDRKTREADELDDENTPSSSGSEQEGAGEEETNDSSVDDGHQPTEDQSNKPTDKVEKYIQDGFSSIPEEDLLREHYSFLFQLQGMREALEEDPSANKDARGISYYSSIIHALDYITDGNPVSGENPTARDYIKQAIRSAFGKNKAVDHTEFVTRLFKDETIDDVLKNDLIFTLNMLSKDTQTKQIFGIGTDLMVPNSVIGNVLPQKLIEEVKKAPDKAAQLKILDESYDFASGVLPEYQKLLYCVSHPSSSMGAEESEFYENFEQTAEATQINIAETIQTNTSPASESVSENTDTKVTAEKGAEEASKTEAVTSPRDEMQKEHTDATADSISNEQSSTNATTEDSATPTDTNESDASETTVVNEDKTTESSSSQETKDTAEQNDYFDDLFSDAPEVTGTESHTEDQNVSEMTDQESSASQSEVTTQEEPKSKESKGIIKFLGRIFGKKTPKTAEASSEVVEETVADESKEQTSEDTINEEFSKPVDTAYEDELYPEESDFERYSTESELSIDDTTETMIWLEEKLNEPLGFVPQTKEEIDNRLNKLFDILATLNEEFSVCEPSEPEWLTTKKRIEYINREIAHFRDKGNELINNNYSNVPQQELEDFWSLEDDGMGGM